MQPQHTHPHARASLIDAKKASVSPDAIAETTMLAAKSPPISEVRYDATDWPVFRITMPGAPLALEKFQEHLDRITAVYERGETFAMLIDALRAPPLNATERQLIADAMRFASRRHPGVLRGLAVCLSSTVARGGFTAINWLARPPYPTSAFESVASASVWLKRQLVLPTPTHIRSAV
jgi:hypothetical protein